MRILVILGCLPLAVLPGLCTCKAGVECSASHNKQSPEHESPDIACSAIEVENSVASVPTFQVSPAELVTVAISTVVESAEMPPSVNRVDARSSNRPHGPPLYLSHCSFVI